MAVIDHLDTTNKLIYLAVGCRAYHPVDDLYHEVRALRRTDESLRRFLNPVSAAGNVPKGGGKFTPRYIIMQNGWRIVPEDVDHTLSVTGEQLTAEGGAGPACFDFTFLSADTKLIVNYQPSEAEIITAGASDLQAVLDAINALNDLSQADVRSALGLATANLDTQLSAVQQAIAGVQQSIENLNDLSAGELRDALGLAAANLDSQLATIQAAIELSRKLLSNRHQTNPTTGKHEYFDDDGSPLLSASIFEDVAGTIPFGPASTKIQRRDKLG